MLTGVIAHFNIGQPTAFFVGCFTCAPDSFELVDWGTWHGCWGLIVEWRNIVTGDKLHWS